MAGHKQAGPDNRNWPLADDVLPVESPDFIQGWNAALEAAAKKCDGSQYHITGFHIRQMKKSGKESGK